MYERFSDRARRAMQLANAAARRNQREYIGTEHILLGIIDQDDGAALQVLWHLGIAPEEIGRRAAEFVEAGPDRVTLRRRPRTPRAKEAIELAIQASRERGDDYVGTHHILLGLIRQEEAVAGVVLREFTSPERLNNALQEVGDAMLQECIHMPHKSIKCGPAIVLCLTSVLGLAYWLVFIWF